MIARIKFIAKAIPLTALWVGIVIGMVFLTEWGSFNLFGMEVYWGALFASICVILAIFKLGVAG